MWREKVLIRMMSRGNFLEVGWDVARGLLEFDEYGSVEVAVKALRRRSPGFSERQCVNTLEKAMRFHRSAVALVDRNATWLFKETNVSNNQWPDVSPLARELRCGYSGFRMSTCRQVILWVFYQNHLR